MREIGGVSFMFKTRKNKKFHTISRIVSQKKIIQPLGKEKP
jgi:hypothetical protein